MLILEEKTNKVKKIEYISIEQIIEYIRKMLNKQKTITDFSMNDSFFLKEYPEIFYNSLLYLGEFRVKTKKTGFVYGFPISEFKFKAKRIETKKIHDKDSISSVLIKPKLVKEDVMTLDLRKMRNEDDFVRTMREIKEKKEIIREFTGSVRKNSLVNKKSSLIINFKDREDKSFNSEKRLKKKSSYLLGPKTRPFEVNLRE